MHKRDKLNSGNIFYKYNASGSAKKAPKITTSNKSYGASQVMKKESIEGRETYSFVGTKEVVDRDGDIVMIDGMDFKNFNNNPVVLWGHDAHSTPVGKVVGVSKNIKDKSLIFDIQFAATEKGKEIETLVKEGVLNATSIGFLIKDWDYDEDLEAYKFLETELLEISIVNIPANQEAIAEDKSFDVEEKVSEEDLRAMIAEVVQGMLPKKEDADEAEVLDEDKGSDEEEVTPEEVPEDSEEEKKEEPKEEVDEEAEDVKSDSLVADEVASDEVVESEDNTQAEMVELLRQIATALTTDKKPEAEEAKVENTESDSQEPAVEPKESEEVQQPDEESSENEVQDEDHSEEESPKEASDDNNLVEVEDLDEDTVFTVVI